MVRCSYVVLIGKYLILFYIEYIFIIYLFFYILENKLKNILICNKIYL